MFGATSTMEWTVDRALSCIRSVTWVIVMPSLEIVKVLRWPVKFIVPVFTEKAKAKVFPATRTRELNWTPTECWRVAISVIVVPSAEIEIVEM